MKVYLAYVDSGCEKVEYDIVGSVFDSERKALDYVIKNRYSEPFYKGMNPAWLDDNARRYVVEMEVK